MENMKKSSLQLTAALFLISLLFVDVSYAEDKPAAAGKVKSFWQKLFEYPANVTNEAAGVVSDAITGTVGVVTKEVKTVGQVTSGDLGKTGDLVTETLVGTAQTASKVIEDTAAIPDKANNGEAK